MGRKYVVRKNGKGYSVAQEDSAEFSGPDELEEYIQRQQRELDRLRKQRDGLTGLETALEQHIAELRVVKPK